MTDTVWVPEGEDQVIEPDGTVVDEKAPAAEEPAVEDRPEKHYRIDVFHHFPDGIPLTLDASQIDLGKLGIDVTGAVAVTIEQPAPPPAPVATKAVLILKDTSGGTNMPGQITVDTTNETVTLAWTDDKNYTNAAAPSNASGAAVPTFSVDNTAIITVGTGNPAGVTPVAEGTANISVSVAYPDGTPVLEADGVTPFPVPSPVAVTVSAGAAVGDALTLSV